MPTQLFKTMLQLMLAPTKGWEDVEADEASGKLHPVSAFYIFTLVASLSWLVQLAYGNIDSFLKAMELALVTYSVFFISFFISTFLLSVSLQMLTRSGYEVSEERVKTLSVCGLSLLETILLLANLLPAPTPVLWFLPLFVAVILWKARLYMHIRPSKVAIYVLVTVLAVLLPPMAMGLIFRILL